MALITCPDCGNQISDKASQCPNCGCPSTAFQPSEPKFICPECGQHIIDIEAVCPICGCPSSEFNKKNIIQLFCPDCGQEISDSEAPCPNCSCPSTLFQKKAIEEKRSEVKQNKTNNSSSVWGCACIIAIMLGFFAWQLSTLNPTHKKASYSQTTNQPTFQEKTTKHNDSEFIGKWKSRRIGDIYTSSMIEYIHLYSDGRGRQWYDYYSGGNRIRSSSETIFNWYNVGNTVYVTYEGETSVGFEMVGSSLRSNDGNLFSK